MYGKLKEGYSKQLVRNLFIRWPEGHSPTHIYPEPRRAKGCLDLSSYGLGIVAGAAFLSIKKLMDVLIEAEWIHNKEEAISSAKVGYERGKRRAMYFARKVAQTLGIDKSTDLFLQEKLKAQAYETLIKRRQLEKCVLAYLIFYSTGDKAGERLAIEAIKTSGTVIEYHAPGRPSERKPLKWWPLMKHPPGWDEAIDKLFSISQLASTPKISSDKPKERIYILEASV